MKKFLLILFLVTGSFFVFAGKEKKAFFGLSTGVTFHPTSLEVESFPEVSIDLGKTIKNSQGTYLGAVSFGLVTGDLAINYAYSYLRTDNWSLGVDGSLLIGRERVVEETTEEVSVETQEEQPAVMEDPVFLALGGKLGLYYRLKVYQSFDLGVQVGVKTQKGLSSDSAWSASEDILGYGYIGLRHYF